MRLYRTSAILISAFALILAIPLNAGYAQQAPPPLAVAPFKAVYSIGMTVTIIGEVNSNFTPGSMVSVRVTNPNGQEYQNASAALSDEGTFSFEYDLKGSKAEVVGIHTVKAKYQNLDASVSFEVKQRATLEISLEKNKYDLGEIVIISGKVSPRLLEQVDIKIYNPKGRVWKFYSVGPDKIRTDGTFRAEVGELSGELSIQGKYRVEASYADLTATATREFDVGIFGKVTPGRFMLVDQTGKAVNEVFVGQQVLVQADLRNNLQERQPFTYFVLITDSAGFTVSLSWLTGTLPGEETLGAAQSWIPDAAGTYSIKIFVWKSVTEPEVLGKQLEKTVTVIE